MIKQKTDYSKNTNNAESKPVQIVDEIILDEKTLNVYDVGGGMFCVNLGSVINSSIDKTKFFIDGTLAEFKKVENIGQIKTVEINQVFFVYGNQRLMSCVYVSNANFGKKFKYLFETTESIISSDEINFIIDKANAFEPNDIKKAKEDIVEIGTRITSLENSSGGTSTVIEEIRNGIAALKTDTEGISRAEDVTNIDSLKTNSLKVYGTVNGELTDGIYKFQKFIRGKPKSLAGGYSDVEVIIYPDNSCVITGILTELTNQNINAGELSSAVSKSYPCQLNAVKYISYNDVTPSGARFAAALNSSDAAFLNIVYKNITAKAEDIIAAKLYFTLKGSKTDLSDINII